VPVVQAGERILFAVKDGQVTAHVQVQFSGDAAEFGWLLPLPAVPTLELGIDELFTQLTLATQPKYRMSTSFDSACSPFYGGTGGGAASGAAGGSATAGGSAGGSDNSPLVVQDSVGPYDYAVLRADSKADMLTWLTDNHYFVPAGTDDSVAPYIHPGAFFLALKLRPGHSSGDVQPVVLRYASDVGMIPLTLTSTGAKEHMGVQVWMLGSARAIPRNYHHTVLNDAVIDWRTSGSNYEDVINRAAAEAPEKHTFVTEYAGTSSRMRGVLAPPSRFGVQADLAAQTAAGDFLRYLFTHGFQLDGTLKAILGRVLPVPAGSTPEQYYPDTQHVTGVIDAPALAQEMFDRIVTPTRAADQLFADLPVLTRLYTTLSPQDMNRDPAFAFNPSLPDINNAHQSEMRVWCDGTTHAEGRAELRTEQGWLLLYPQGRFGPPATPLDARPASLRIETLGEEGPPEVIVDHSPTVSTPATHHGCSSTGEGVALLLVAAVIQRTRRFARGA